MKKFITSMALQAGRFDAYCYEAVGNSKLQMETEVHFPILTAISGYAQEGEEIRVFVVTSQTPPQVKNQALLEEELHALCQAKGFHCPRGLELVVIPNDQQVDAHLETFQKLIDLMEDDDELFACATYGTKPQAQAVMMAVQYGYRIKHNTSIGCIVYGEIARRNPDSNTWSTAKVYDVTALTQMDEIVRVLADRKVADPKSVIEHILNL